MGNGTRYLSEKSSMKEVVAGLKMLLTENTSETWKAESLLIEQLAKQVRGRKPESEEKVKMWMKRELSNDKFLKELIHPEPLRGEVLRDFKRKVSKLVNQSWEKLLKTEGKQLPSVSTSMAPASDSVEEVRVPAASDSVTIDDCILEEPRVHPIRDSVTIDDCILEEPRVHPVRDSVTNDDCILEEIECSLEEPRVPAASDSVTIDDCILEEVQVPAASDSMTIDDCSLAEPRVPPVSDSVTKNECACSLEEPRVPPVRDSVTNDDCSLEEAQGSSVSDTVTKNFCILEEPRVPPASDSVTNDFCILEDPWVHPASDSVINDDCSLEELLDSCDVDPTFLEQSIPSQDWFLAEVTQNGSTVPDISFAEINDEHHLFPPPPTWTHSQVQSAAPHGIYTQAGYSHTIVSSSGRPCFDEFGTRLTSSTMVSRSPLNGWQMVQRDRVYTPPELPVVWTAPRLVMSVRQVGSSHTSLPAPPPPSDVLHVEEPSVDMDDEEGSVCNCETDEEGSWDSWDEVDEDRSDYSTSSEASGDELGSEDSCYYSHGSDVDEAPGDDLDALDEAPRVQDEAPRDQLDALVEAPRDQLNALDEAPRDHLDAPPSPPSSVLENEVPPCRKRKQEETECEVPIKLAKVLEPCPVPPATPSWGDHAYAASRDLPPSSSLNLPNPLPSSPYHLSGEAANVSAAELHPRLPTSSPQQPPLSSPVQVDVVLSQTPPPSSASDVHAVPRSHEHEDPFSGLQGLDIYATLKKLITQAQDNLGTLDTVDRENPVRNAVEKKNCFPRDSLSDEQFRKA